MRSSLTIRLNFVLLLLMAWSTASVARGPGQAQAGWVWNAATGASEQVSADFSDAVGDVSVTRTFANVGLGYAWDRKTSVSLSLGMGSADYDFSSNAVIEGFKPWERVQEYRLAMPVRFSPGENISAIVIPSVRSYAESGASMSEGRSEGILGGFSWRFSDALSIGPGIGWFSSVGDESNVFPIVLIDWQITQAISLTTGRGLAASRGPGLSLNYTVNPKWTLGITARHEETRFALERADDRRAEVGEDSSTPLLLTLNYSPWPSTYLTALVGVELGGSMAIEDGRGHTIAESDIDTAMMFGLTLQGRF